MQATQPPLPFPANRYKGLTVFAIATIALAGIFLLAIKPSRTVTKNCLDAAAIEIMNHDNWKAVIPICADDAKCSSRITNTRLVAIIHMIDDGRPAERIEYPAETGCAGCSVSFSSDDSELYLLLLEDSLLVCWIDKREVIVINGISGDLQQEALNATGLSLGF